MIPVSKPSITEREIKYATEALLSGWISSKGPCIEKFEDAWAEANDYNFGTACNSGTSALLLALRALGIKEGDEVIVPDFTMVATAWAVTYTGATPVFVDCKEDLTIDPEQVERAITKNTKAIIPVHVYGKQCAMWAIKKIAYEYNLFIVEDMAEAHGIEPEGDIACYSFYGNKILTTGEGGMCLTNDPRLKKQMDHLRSMAFDTNHTFLHKKLGYNLRMTNIQAAIGLAQVERREEIYAKRKQVYLWYKKHLPKKVLPKWDPETHWVMPIFPKNMEKTKSNLTTADVEYREFFKPMTSQPMYKYTNFTITADRLSEAGIYLPLYPDLTEEDVIHIARNVV